MICLSALLGYGLPAIGWANPFEAVAVQGSSNAREMTESITQSIAGYSLGYLVNAQNGFLGWTTISGFLGSVSAASLFFLGKFRLTSGDLKPAHWALKYSFGAGFMATPTWFVAITNTDWEYFYSASLWTVGVGLAVLVYSLLADPKKSNLTKVTE